jgi:flagellar hook-associated protein 3 FlgL
MRVTEGMRYTTTQRALGELRSRHAAVVEQITSGQRVGDPSDDPIAAAELTRIGSRLARNQDYQRTIDSSRSNLSLTERTLDSASQLMVRVHEIAVQGANGSLSGENRRALAVEVNEIREQLVSLANTQGSNGYLFSGSQTATAAFSAAGAYQGDATIHQAEIAPGVVVNSSVLGSDAFGVGTSADAFQAVTALEQALLADNTQQIAGTLTNVEAARSQIVQVQAQSGLILNRLDSASEALSIGELELKDSSARLGETDVVSALSELSALTTTLDQAIAVARETLSSGRGWF